MMMMMIMIMMLKEEEEEEEDLCFASLSKGNSKETGRIRTHTVFDLINAHAPISAQ